MISKMTNKKPVLLTDEQIQKFICDGFIVLQTNVKPEVHEYIDDRFNFLEESEPNPGNNIMAKIPELNQIVECPVVQGALHSLLGEDYLFHPHMYWHSRKPAEENKGEEFRFNQVQNGSHQDAYTPCVQAKSHKFQYLRFMYYSHDIELDNGPTHVVPGSHYHSVITPSDRKKEMPVIGKAGTVFFSHFDLIHAGCPNYSDRVRNMIKFIFVSGQQSPQWHHQVKNWQTPKDIKAPMILENCWEHQWQEFTQEKRTLTSTNGTHKYEDVLLKDLSDTQNTAKRLSTLQKLSKQNHLSEDYIQPMMNILKIGTQSERTEALYCFKKIGVSAIPILIDSLLNKNEKCEDLEGIKYRPEIVFNSKYSCEDESYALIAISANGLCQEVCEAIQPLLNSNDHWRILNGVHIVNDMQCEHALSVEVLKRKLFDKDNGLTCMVRSQIVNAIGSIGTNEMAEILCDVLDFDWGDSVFNRSDWTENYSIHYNAAMGLARMGKKASGFEERMFKHLEHPYGQVGICLVESIKRIENPNTMLKLVEHLQTRRWDASLRGHFTY